MRATIKMIAEQAGVSIGTVDRVLHNRPYVKPEVRERVLQVMEALDYRPNRMASALALSGTNRCFAVVQPAWQGYVGEAIAAGVTKFREERRDYNLSVTVRTYHQGRTAECLQHLEDLENEGVQGIALCASDCPAIRRSLTELSRRRIPVVTFNSDIAGSERLCFVGENALRAGRLAGEIAAKFLHSGDRVLLVYAGPEYAGHKGRADGFLDRLEELGFSREAVRIAATHEDYDETFAAVSAALREEPELRCIYMANRSVTACAEALRQAGLAGHVRLLAHDNSPEIRSLLREGVLDFTIGQDLSYQTRKALSVLFDAVLEHKRPKRDSYYPDSPILTAENC